MRALQVGQLMIAMTTRVEPAGASLARLLPHPAERASGPTPAATRRTCVNRSMDTTTTSCSTRSTSRTRTRHMTPRRRCVPISGGAVPATPPARGPERDGAGRTSWSWSQSRWRPLGAIATESMSPRRCHASECRNRQPRPPAARGRVGRPPRSERRRGSGPLARTSGVRTRPARPRRPATPRPAVRRRCSRPGARAPPADCDERRLTGTPDPSVLLASRVVHARPPRHCLRGTMRRCSHRPRTAQPRLSDDQLAQEASVRRRARTEPGRAI